VRDFKFRHHFETNVEDKKELQNITYRQIKSLSPLKDIVKVRMNHIGQIVKVGEY
jgi:CRISPR-associated endonuclease Csn1